MSPSVWLSSFALLAVMLNGCTPANTKPQLVALPVDGQALVLAGSQTMTTIRQRPVPGLDKTIPIMCSQPSPDWAVAVGTAAEANGNATTPAGIKASLDGKYTVSEAITEFAGRTAGVVALRDGLYSACQAYANGVIGQDAYALILSQYGTLLVELVGANTTPTASAAPVAAATDTEEGKNAAAKKGTPEVATTTASAGTPTVSPTAIMQMETVQALVTACISANDPTRLGQVSNPLLDEITCKAVLSAVASKIPTLLTPAGVNAKTRA